MRELGNVLYIQTQGAVAHLEHDTVRVEADRESKLRVPVLRLAGIVAFGRVTLTPFLIHRFAEDGRFIAWLDRRGRYKARVEGSARGNVLLRRAQHLTLSDEEATSDIARQIVAGKVQNSRQLLLRAARDSSDDRDMERLSVGAERLAATLQRLRSASNLDAIRGCEGEAARAYLGLFSTIIRRDRGVFRMDGRSKRPPRDRVNAVLSFLYAMLRVECAAATESIGLDPQVGYLHSLRPGRPALALDLMEELRSVVADRVALTLINRRELTGHDFEDLPGGVVQLTEEGRRKVITAYQKRKDREVQHRVLREPIQLGLVPHVQARLLARHLRGELNHYPPYLYR